MYAMVFNGVGKKLMYMEVPTPTPSINEILIRVHTCGICRTDLHIIDGELQHPQLPLILGHQVIGVIEQLGHSVQGFKIGQRVGVPWLGRTCGKCEFCHHQQENLCDDAAFTGYQINGGFAEYCVANSQFCFQIPDSYSDIQAAPLMCGGLIAYRSLVKTNHAQRLGLYGFGSAAHQIIQVARHQQRDVYVFTRSDDQASQHLALKLGATWVGDSKENSPVPLDAAIIFAPAGELVPAALRNLRKGGMVVCAGIHMSDIPSFPYEILWGERSVCSVANLTRKDGEVFLKLATEIPIYTETHVYPLQKVNEALDDLRHGNFSGSGVIDIMK